MGNFYPKLLDLAEEYSYLSISLSQRTEFEHRFAVEVATTMPATDGSFELKDIPESD